MSWRELSPQEFDPHGGRNAFRNDDDLQSTSARVASFRAMRSFTESIECDLPPAPELPAQLDIDRISMKTSDTTETIVEVLKSSSTVDPSLGETQKYKMSVPGPGHSEQEHELHKSLLRDDDDLDSEVEGAAALVPEQTDKSDGPPSAFAKHVRDPEHAALRREYSNSSAQRPRPTTPTHSCALERFAFNAPFEGSTEVKKEEKIKVSIPTKERSASRRRKSDMPYSDFYENISSQIPVQARTSFSGRSTPMNDYEGDILEENPQYKNKAPPAPVVHRRTSIEWENFEEAKANDSIPGNQLAAEESTSAPEKPKEAAEMQMQPSEDEEPTFSEDMLEEREKVMVSAMVVSHEESDSVVQSPPGENGQAEKDAAHGPGAELEVAPTTVTSVAAVELDTGPSSQKDKALDETLPSTAEAAEVNRTEEQAQAEVSDIPAEEQEQSYDATSYPGYIWNYDTQQWEVDPNYDPSQHSTADYSYQYDYGTGAQADSYTYQAEGYEPTPYAETYAYDQNDGYIQPTYPQATDGSTYGHDAAAYAGYDQNYGYSQTSTHLGYPTVATAQYDTQPIDSQGTGFADGSYYQQQHAGYDQTVVEFSEPPIGTDYEADPTVASMSAHVYGPVDTATQPSGDYSYSSYSHVESSYPGYQHSGVPYAEASGHVPTEATTSHQYTSQQYYPTVSAQPFPSTTFTEPLFQSTPAPDPYAWDTRAAEPMSQSAAEQPSPSKSPLPSRPAPPKFPRTGAGDEQGISVAAATQRAPPPRPPAASPVPPTGAPPRPGPPTPRPSSSPVKAEPEPEEDAWTQFKKLTEKVNVAVKSTEGTLKNLSETTTIKDIKDESYLGQVGGSQGYVDNVAQKEIHRLTEEKKQEKKLKKKLKQQGKKAPSPTFDPDKEAEMDRAAQELARKMANMRTDLGDWKPPSEAKAAEEVTSMGMPPSKKFSLEDDRQDSDESMKEQHMDSSTPKGDIADNEPKQTAPAWADFETAAPELPPSESGFFSNKDNNVGDSAPDGFDPFIIPTQFTQFIQKDPFAPPGKDLIEEDYDPFAVQPVEDIVAAAKAKADEIRMKKEAQEDVDFFAGARQSPALSSPTPEGGSPATTPSHRPDAFEDDFKLEGVDEETPTPLYDEDDSEPLTEFAPKFTGDGWQLMIRHPIKKKTFMAERCWKPCFVRLHNNTLLVYNSKNDNQPIQELQLQATYSLSDTTLQAYDVYGKIHTVKLQFVLYKERVGIRPGQISRLVDGHITKYGLPLEHSAQCTVLMKLGSLTYGELQSFVTTVEDVLFRCPAKRETKPVYKQDEVQIHCYDEYSAHVNKDGIVSEQKARVRLFCLAFVSGSPFLEIGLNDRRRQGKEIVRRKDILPMYTERWIRFEELEFHSTVDQAAFEREQVIRLSPPDGCFFEVMRFRIRPPRNREKFITITAVMKIAGSKVEIRMEAMAAAQVEKTRGGKSTRRQIPCEDIAIRFPIPEAWIYIFREERHWGVGSVHSKKLRPGKVKNLKDRLLGAVQSNEQNLIECAIGEAKYEHVYRSLVWRIPRLPEKHHAAYKSHLLKCRFELSSFDLMPETFLPLCDVEFTMPLATVSNTVVRSVSVEQHEDSDRVEKFVRYVAKCQYKVEIDYVQCADLEVDTLNPNINPDVAMTTVPELHQPAFQPAEVEQVHEGYRIDLTESEVARAQHEDSSSDDDDDKSHKMPIIQIDMKNYGY